MVRFTPNSSFTRNRSPACALLICQHIFHSEATGLSHQRDRLSLHRAGGQSVIPSSDEFHKLPTSYRCFLAKGKQPAPTRTAHLTWQLKTRFDSGGRLMKKSLGWFEILFFSMKKI